MEPTLSRRSRSNPLAAQKNARPQIGAASVIFTACLEVVGYLIKEGLCPLCVLLQQILRNEKIFARRRSGCGLPVFAVSAESCQIPLAAPDATIIILRKCTGSHRHQSLLVANDVFDWPTGRASNASKAHRSETQLHSSWTFNWKHLAATQCFDSKGTGEQSHWTWNVKQARLGLTYMSSTIWHGSRGQCYSREQPESV